MQLQFAHGWILFMVWVVLALAAGWLMLYRRRQQALKSFLADPMLSKLAPSTRPFRFYWQIAFILAGLFLLLIAAARPQWGTEERTVFQRGRDLIIVLDVSRSMLARDVHPNRLQRAKADVQDLLRELRGDRVALFTFRGHAVQLCPLTTDYAYLEQILDDVTVESAPRGETNIGDAIEKALVAFESDEGAHRAMILISDGEDLAGQAKSAAEKAGTQGVVIFTVGLGDPKGATIPGVAKADSVITYQGKEVISKLQHETLKEIAGITGGAYVPVGVANVKLGKLYSEHLSKISARDIEESLQKRMIERYQFFLFPGVLALLVGALLSRGRLALRKKSPAFAGGLPQGASPDLSGQPMKIDFSSANAAKLLTVFICLTPVIHGRAGQPCPAVFSAAQAVRPYLFAFPICQVNQVFAETNTAPVTVASNQNAAFVTAAVDPEKTALQIEKNFPTGRPGASKAQGLYRRGAYRQSASAYRHAMSNSNQRLQNDCLFNAGCSFYRGNDYANAAESFNQLGNRENTDQSKVYYNLGCATYRLAEQSDKMVTNRPPELKPMLLEKAGNAFQRSLRANNDFQNAAANLAAITNMLPKAREDAKLQALMAKYGAQPPSQMADTMLENQRNISKALPGALTNASPARISQFEALAEQQRANCDLLIPLKVTLASALAQQGQAGQQQIPQLGQHLEAMQNSMNEAYESLRNIDNRSFKPVKTAEHGVYNLWKGLASFEKLLQEDIRRQTNTITMTTSVLAETGGKINAGASLAKPVQKAATSAAPAGKSSGRSFSTEKESEIESLQTEQNEARQLTGLFSNRFAQAVPPEGTPADGKLPGMPSAPMPDEGTRRQSTNEAPRISRETRTNILFLAEQAVKTQIKASQFLALTNLESSLPEQRHSYDLLKEIEKLLPKDENKQNDQKNQDQQKQPQDQKQDQDQKQENQDKQPPPPQPDQQPPPPKQEEKPPQPREQPSQPEEKEQKDQKEMTPEQLRALLEKALQREKEHREDKMHDEYIPPSPVERDW